MGLFSRPPYPLLAAGSLAWHVSRWGKAFSASFFLSHEDSAVLSQGVGAWVPMLVGGFFGGLLSDLYDVKRLVAGTQWCCQPRLRRAILVVVGAAVRWPEPWRSMSTPDDSIAA